ncbi:MAG: hypothetical protein IJN41_04990 [Firmicutes bacterium]|nr:hypothetical protein [Bacillota bacterium]
MDHKRRGSMMIEASLILPMCLTLCMVMAGTFRFLQLEESLYYSGFLQMRQCSTDMSLDASSAKISRLYLEHRIIERSRREMGAEQKHWIELMGIAEEGMFFSPEEWDQQSEIRCRIHCRWSLGNDSRQGYFSDEIRFTGRVWRGEDSVSVWIFPDWGECYHKESCYITGGTKIRTVESAALEQGYRPCQHCMKGE